MRRNAHVVDRQWDENCEEDHDESKSRDKQRDQSSHEDGHKELPEIWLKLLNDPIGLCAERSRILSLDRIRYFAGRVEVPEHPSQIVFPSVS